MKVLATRALPPALALLPPLLLAATRPALLLAVLRLTVASARCVVETRQLVPDIARATALALLTATDSPTSASKLPLICGACRRLRLARMLASNPRPPTPAVPAVPKSVQ